MAASSSDTYKAPEDFTKGKYLQQKHNFKEPCLQSSTTNQILII